LAFQLEGQRIYGGWTKLHQGMDGFRPDCAITILQILDQFGDRVFLAVPCAQATLCIYIKEQDAQNPNSRLCFHSLL
jgi:hypothetical protein